MASSSIERGPGAAAAFTGSQAGLGVDSDDNRLYVNPNGTKRAVVDELNDATLHGDITFTGTVTGLPSSVLPMTTHWVTTTVNLLRWQRLTFDATADDGAFTLEYDGVETEAIASGFNAAAIEAALDEIPALTGKVTVAVMAQNPSDPMAFVVRLNLAAPVPLAVGTNTLVDGDTPVVIDTGSTPACYMSLPLLDVQNGDIVQAAILRHTATTWVGEAGTFEYYLFTGSNTTSGAFAPGTYWSTNDALPYTNQGWETDPAYGETHAFQWPTSVLQAGAGNGLPVLLLENGTISLSVNGAAGAVSAWEATVYLCVAGAATVSDALL